MRRLAQIASVLLTLPFVLSGYAEAAEPTVINLSCDGTLTGTYGTDKPKSMEASQKISVVVDLDDQTVFFLGYVVPIYDVDQQHQLRRKASGRLRFQHHHQGPY